MTERESSSTAIQAIASEAFIDNIEQDAVEVVSGDSEKSVEIQANQWTLTIEGDTPDVAFLAVDDEPTSDREMRNVIDDIVGRGDLNALKLIDQRLEGRLSLALHISGDPLSQHLASVLAAMHPSGPQ